MNYTKKFEDVSSKDVAQAGGKGASLGEMTQAGIPVPTGYVILADAFDAFLEETDLGVQIQAILDTVNTQAVHTVDEASEKIVGLILSAMMPDDIKQEILSQFDVLGADYVAVRSSATSEDSASAAWAGQLNTYLNTTQENLLKNVQKCWASLFTPRAIFYRFEQGLANHHISVAVVVQKMIQSEMSGIAFSVHPVTQDRNQLIIEAGFGLGEAIVSGAVTPDSYVVKKDILEIADINVNHQNRKLVIGAGSDNEEETGNHWVELSQEEGSSQVLSEQQIIELSELIIKIENHYSFPCDIEWAFEKGEFFITQSRPITTLDHQIIIEQGKRTQKMEVLVSRKYVPLLSDVIMKAYSDIENYRTFYECDFYTRCGCMSGQFYYGPEAVDFGDVMMKKEVTKKGSILASFERIYKFGEKLRKRSEEIRHTNYIETGADQALKDFTMFIHDYTPFVISLMGYNIQYPIESSIRKAVARLGDPENALAVLTFPIKENIVSFEQRNLLKIGPAVRDAKSFTDISESAKEKIQQHIDEFGWISTRGGLSEPPTPEDIYNRIKELGDNYEEQLETQLKIKKAHIKEFDALYKQIQLDDKLANIINIAKELVYFRTYRTDYINMLFFNIRGALTAIARGCDLTLDDIVHLRIDEIINTTPVDRGEIDRRKVDYALFTLKPNEVIFSSDPVKMKKIREENCAELEVPEGLIKGNVAFKGCVIGKVAIVRTKDDLGKIRAGDILVAPMTTPDFITAMERATAFVTDEGGITCHAAIVSREMQKPCIIGTKVATRVLKDGDMVEVDANSGVVRVINSADSSDVLNNYDIDDYQRLFRVVAGAVAFHASDVFRRYYEKLETILTVKDGVWTSYIPIVVRDRLLDEGVKLYSSKELFNEYKKTFGKYITESTKYFKKILKKEKLDKEDIENSYRMIDEQFLHYSKTELYFTDKAYRLFIKNNNYELGHNLSQLEKLKNKGREHLNYIFFGADGFVTQMANKVAKQFNIEESNICLYKTDEIIALFDGEKVGKDELDKRSRSFVTISDGNKTEYLTGDNAIDFIEMFDKSRDFEEGILRGVCANEGKITGKVKVISSDYYFDFSLLDKLVGSMNQGDILVAETTSPELMEACMKASAIITDQGGLLSHAAIISREMNIPCLVATNNATQILKDGDLVEVDANSGVVRVLGKGKK